MSEEGSEIKSSVEIAIPNVNISTHIHSDVIERSYESLIAETNSIIGVLEAKIAEMPFVGSVGWERLAKAVIKIGEAREELQKMRNDEVDKEETTSKLEEMGKWNDANV
jgi:hypothetical protein